MGDELFPRKTIVKGADMQEIFEKIKERLEEKAFDLNRFYCYYNEGFNVGLKNAIEIVNQVAEEYSNSEIPNMSDGWIPCSEEKSPLYKRVLISVDVDGEMEIGIAERNGDFEWLVDEFYSYTEADGRVIAWQPLPEPYQPKGEQ